MEQRRYRPEWIDGKKASVFLAAIVLAVDQLSKLWVERALPQYQSVPSSGIMRITHVVNSDFVLGIGAPYAVKIVLPLAAMAAACFLYWRYIPHRSRAMCLAMGLLIGGGLGNLLDRALMGGVTDFIDLGVSHNVGRLIFNIADICCIAGIIVIDFVIIRLRLVHVPRRQHLLSYVWNAVVTMERSRPARRWWKPVSRRPDR